ncbi:MAG: hypothetical protein HY795_05375 [Desulfovibrio sp.]|nr:hypothetical protein [Desulfovibrio sp.]MBI4959263.1 hypothetical protein [Desulfovibrio sp.]
MKKASGGQRATPFGIPFGFAAWIRHVAVLALVLALSACGQSGVELVQNGTVPENPTAPVGLAIKSYAGFKEVTWEQFTDAQGVTRVLATGQYRMDLPEIQACPRAGQGGFVLAARAFLRMTFTVDEQAKTFAFTGAEFLVYSPKGWSMSYPAGLSAFEAILQGTSGLSCGVLYAPGP